MIQEIQAGLARPLQPREMVALLKEHLPALTEHHEAAEVLRARVQNGIRTIDEIETGRIQGLTPAEVESAKQLLASLREELRGHDAHETLGLGMVMAYGVGSMLAEAGASEGWQPPAGSVIRIVLPGLLNLAVDLTAQEGWEK